jgi:AbrB family looped-hinge helix DNA binding protein
MIASSALVSTKYQVVIPKEVRKILDIQPGSRLIFLVDDGIVFMRPEPANYTEQLRGLHRDVWATAAATTGANDATAWLEAERAAWT